MDSNKEVVTLEIKNIKSLFTEFIILLAFTGNKQKYK